MHPRRIFINPESHDGDRLQLRGQEAHYLLHVLRLRKGDEVSVFDGRGWACRAEIAETWRGSATLRPLESRHAQRSPKAFTIAQAVLKAPAMDAAIQRCTELGAAAIIGFYTARTVPRGGGTAGTDQKLARWQKLAIEGCRQCRRDFLPEIKLLPGIEEIAACIQEFDQALLASLGKDSHPISEILSPDRIRKTGNVLLIVGPEGDFSGGELVRLLEAGAIPCRLSDAVLRAETAAAAGAAIIGQHLMTAATPGEKR
jgi:16S rRNA (uracil1498-N3)-methyltransferase